MNIKTFLLSAFAFMAITVSSASTTSITSEDGQGKKYKQLRAKFIEMVDSVKNKFNFNSNEEVHICFRIENNRDITIEDVISDNKELADFIKIQLKDRQLEVNAEDFETETSYWITLDYTVL